MPPSQPKNFDRRAENAGNSLSRFGRKIDEFWQRVTDGIEVQVLWAQFVADNAS